MNEEQNMDTGVESLNETPKEEMEQPTEDQSDEQSQDEQSGDDVVKVSKADYERFQKAEEVARNQRIRAEKAEKENKLKGNSEKSDGFSKEEGRLYAKVYNNSDIPSDIKDSAIERVMRIAQVDGVSVDEAYQSEDFSIWKEARLKEKLEKEAQLGNSRGAKSKQKKTLGSEGLSAEEHKALFNQYIGK